MTQLHSKIKELQLRSAPINYSSTVVDAKGELNEAEDGGKAYFCIWGVRDSYGTAFMKGCFSKSIRERGPESSANQKIAFCWQHDVRDPIGRFLVLREDEIGLYGEWQFDDIEAVPSAKRAKSQIRSGTINGYSFGFEYLWDKMEYIEEDDVILIKEAELYEGSPVTCAAIKETKTVRSIAELETEKQFLDSDTEDFIKSTPRSKQLELRQLIARHISLASVKPNELRQTSLNNDQPIEQLAEIGGYKLDLKTL